MKKILVVAALVLLLFLPACGGVQMTTHSQASAYSKQYSRIVLFQGVIYKNGDKYGKYEVTNTDAIDKLITYKTIDGTVVATMELKGVSPESAVLNLDDGTATTLRMREMEIDVNEEDGAIYLIKEMILVKSVALVDSSDSVNNEEDTKEDTEEGIEEDSTTKDDIERVKLDHEKAKVNASVKISGQSQANVDLRYNFKKGDSLHYNSTENTTIKISMGGDMGGMMGSMGGDMGMTTKFMIETDFHINIKSVNSDKSANFETVINSFKVYSMPDKNLMASDQGMKGLKVKGIITNKGQVQFLEDLYIVKTKDGQTLLVSGKASQKDGKVSTSASATANGEKVELQATFDPKTGKLTASSRVSKVKKISKKKVTIKKDDSKIDILPKRIMELFLLPENNISLGQEVEFKAPMMKVNFTAVKGGEENCVNLSSKVITDKANKIEGMDDEMLAMYPTMDAKVNSKFDTKKGCLKEINGVIGTHLDMQGMKMDVNSKIKMKKVK